VSEIPETPTAAARALIGWFAGGLAFECVHQFSDGHTTASVAYGIGAIGVAFFDYKLPNILASSPRLTKSLNSVAADARLWVAVAMLSLFVIALSPYVQQKSWPFIELFQRPFPDESTKTVQKALDNNQAELAAVKKDRDAAQARIRELETPSSFPFSTPPPLSPSALDKLGTIHLGQGSSPSLFSEKPKSLSGITIELCPGGSCLQNPPLSLLPSAKEAELESSLTAKTRELGDIKERLNALTKKQERIGPLRALSWAKNLAAVPDQWVVFVTYPQENFSSYNFLTGLLRDRLNPWIMNAPDSSTDLDAPKFPSPSSNTGFTFHGDNALNTRLSQLLSSCFVVRHTDREMEGLSEWLYKRLSEPERKENRKVTWIEIGQGSPWRVPPTPDCLQ
jgi:hypothetical protein